MWGGRMEILEILGFVRSDGPYFTTPMTASGSKIIVITIRFFRAGSMYIDFTRCNWAAQASRLKSAKFPYFYNPLSCIELNNSDLPLDSRRENRLHLFN